eukprot:TRINITY_DN15817_c0_g7_i1.p1 TRINITY_DN15817_c0_g7~~TRINITY_DN15817_c0_g7_i1.p1  ORF type:complete len:278 (+),score=2.57 TRINITY_DN15817_c0_g7_i1:114-947(+)
MAIARMCLVLSPLVGVMCGRLDSETQCQLAGDPYAPDRSVAMEYMWVSIHSLMVLPSCAAGYAMTLSSDCTFGRMADCRSASAWADVHFNMGADQDSFAGLVLREHEEVDDKEIAFNRNTTQMHPVCAWTIVDDLRAVYNPRDRLRTSPNLKMEAFHQSGFITQVQKIIALLSGYSSNGIWEALRSNWLKNLLVRSRPVSIKNILKRKKVTSICWSFTNDYMDMAKNYARYAKQTLRCSIKDETCCRRIRAWRQREAPSNENLQCGDCWNMLLFRWC